MGGVMRVGGEVRIDSGSVGIAGGVGVLHTAESARGGVREAILQGENRTGLPSAENRVDSPRSRTKECFALTNRQFVKQRIGEAFAEIESRQPPLRSQVGGVRG